MRLTYKRGKGILVENNIDYGLLTNICYQNCVDKLGKLEDIEQEFEIDSIEDLRDRLTKYKFLANHEMSCVDANAYNLMLGDLNNYHSIEEELGIDLIKFFMGFKKNVRVYYKTGKKKIKIAVMTLGIFQKYGKTWAFTREELER